MEVLVNEGRRKFDKDFKSQAVKMVLEDGLTRAEVARRLGVGAPQIFNWVRAHLIDGPEAFPGNGNLRPVEEELRRLRQENKELRLEAEFLKKSAAYFASLKK